MRTFFNSEITIEASAQKVWHVLGEQFCNISDWASVIERSGKASAQCDANSLSMTDRYCDAKGFGRSVEKLTEFDADKMAFCYLLLEGRVLEGHPPLVSAAGNHWSVIPGGDNQSTVKSAAYLEMPAIPGIVLLPLFKLFMKPMARKLFEELKYYCEQGKPHPRKQKLLDAYTPT
jgi:Polyketide cyclase / dehydrase and lipid transport